MTKDLRQNCENRLDALKDLRLDFEEEVYDVARFAQPSRSRFVNSGRGSSSGRTDKSQRNKRRIWHSKLQDAKGIGAFRTLTHGITTGLTSNSRPWFTLTIRDSAVLDEPGVRDWLSEVEKRMYAFIAGSNFYGAAKSGYAENGLFGTEACVMREHDTKGLVCNNLTFGEYWIACGDGLDPDVLYRHVPMTAREAVHTFKKDAPKNARNSYDQSRYTDICNIYQAIEPDKDYNPNRFGGKPWRSVYWDADSDEDSVISVSGYHEKPFWAARWDINGNDTYGSSPGMDCLPSLRELQMQTKRSNEAVDLLVKPEKVVPPGLRLKGQAGSVVTGTGITKDSVVVPYQMPYQAIAAIDLKIEKCYQQIDELSYAELFNAITNMQGIQPRTVEEIASRNEEKLTQLGPVIDRLSNEKLSVVIDRVYGILLRGGLIPPPPPALAGRKIEVEFVSILAQMQRMVGIGQIERTAGFVGNLAGLKPEAADKLDTDELIDEYAERAGSPPKIIRSSKEVEKDRAQRAQQQQMQQAAEMAPAAKQGAEAARLLSEADNNGRSVADLLTR